MIFIIALAALGFLLSLYLFTIEQKIKADPNYHPSCNINDVVSCTKPLQSPYGKLFGFSNSILGLIFYPMLALLALFSYPLLLFYASLGVLLFTSFLAYLLLFKIKAACPICLAIYAVNIAIFLTAYLSIA